MTSLPPYLDETIQHDPIGARRAIDAALTTDPDNIALIEARIRTLLRCYDMPAVVSAAQHAMSRFRTPNLSFWLGGALMHLGNPHAALTHLADSARLAPTAARLDVLARCQHRVGALGDCIATLRKLAERPEEPLTPLYAGLRGLAYALRDAGQWREADAVMTDLLARHQARPGRVAVMAVNFDMAHPFPGWRPFINKAGLAETLSSYRARNPQAPVFWPETFRLPQDHAALLAWRDANPEAPLAIKPNDLFGGQGITITRALPPETAAGCVAQRYIDPPALIDGHKFHLRLYVVITTATPLRAYLWHEGIVRLAPEPYANDRASLGNPAAHITNTSLHAGHPSLHLSTDPMEEDIGHVRALSAVLRRLTPDAWDRLRALAGGFIACAADTGVFRAQTSQHTRWCFPPILFALDIVLGQEGRPWLLEVQYNPAITGSPLVNRLHAPLFNAAFRLGAYTMADAEASAREQAAARRESEVAGFERLDS